MVSAAFAAKAVVTAKRGVTPEEGLRLPEGRAREGGYSDA